MIEQMILDSGRVQVGWLLPEPFFNTAAVQKRSTLGPYAKLASPAWAAANLAFLKDLDFLESRVKTAKDKPRQQATTEAAETPGEEPKAKAKWKPRKGVKGVPRPSSEFESRRQCTALPSILSFVLDGLARNALTPVNLLPLVPSL